MASKKPIVLDSNGEFQQLQSGDTLNATVSEVDVVSKTNDNASPITIGQAVYVKSNGNVDLARANASATCKTLGLVAQSSISAAAAGSIQTDGVLASTTGAWDALTGDTGGLTPGAYYFVSGATAGSITKTPTTTTGQYVQQIGLALSTTEMEISIARRVLL